MSGNIPPDPFNSGGVNFRSMYMSLVASGFKEPEALEISIRVNCAILAKMT